jgi:hypothetical protein
MSLFNRIQYFYALGQHLGLGWLLFRIVYSLKLHLGYFQWRLPSGQWQDFFYAFESYLIDSNLVEETSYLAYRRQQAPAFFFHTSDLPRYQDYFLAWDESVQQQNSHNVDPIAFVKKLATGFYSFFNHKEIQASFPPQWHHNPFSNITAPHDLHWSEISDFGSGDIKIIWEQSRFGSTYALVRAYGRTQDNHYAELFWRLVEDWYENNPPLQGVNWKCGQEISFRVMAWCFGLYGFLDAPATTGLRVTKLAQAIALSGTRIALNLDYALSQNNNHGISEALGLWTIGILFPEFKAAAQWEKQGRLELEKQGKELIYEDGAFSQQSVNYHRVMLHDYLWALRLGDILQKQFTSELRHRVGKAGHLLYQLQDLESGHLPCYGANDGALVLPLNNCEYLDFRPIVQAIHYLIHGDRCFPPNTHDEDLLWLFGEQALQSVVRPPAQNSIAAKESGYYTIRQPDSFVFTRCGKFRHRPSHADLLHIDLWWQGQNIAIDPGTYSYNAPPPWDQGLECTRYHNTVTVDGLEQMERASKFLWLPWATGAEIYHNYKDNQLIYWEGRHNGYQRLSNPVNYQRAILSVDRDSWLIVDQLNSNSSHEYILHWLVPNWPQVFDSALNHLQLITPKGKYYISVDTDNTSSCSSIVSADALSPQGWKSHYYYDKSPALSFNVTTRSKSVLYATFFSPNPANVIISSDCIQIQTVCSTHKIKIRKDNSSLFEVTSRRPF